MAIDTENKRRSCVSHKIPGLGIRPIPNSEISKSDRRHSGLYYAGIDARFVSTTFWTPVSDASSSNWVQSSDASSTWKRSTMSTASWVKQQETEDE